MSYATDRGVSPYDNLDRLSKAIPSGQNAEGNAWLKLLTAANRKVAWGSVTATWPGGSRLSSTTNVTHGLGATPVLILFGSKTAGTDWVSSSPGATTFTVQGDNTDGTSLALNTQRSAYWLAIA